MNKTQVICTTLIVFFLSLGCIGTYFCYNEVQAQNNTNYVNASMITNRYPVVTATFHSPAVIIETASVSEFLQKAQSVNASVVYQTNSEGYVVVDSTFTYAYNLPIAMVYPNYFLLTLVFFALSGFTLWIYIMKRTLEGPQEEEE